MIPSYSTQTILPDFVEPVLVSYLEARGKLLMTTYANLDYIKRSFDQLGLTPDVCKRMLLEKQTAVYNDTKQESAERAERISKMTHVECLTYLVGYIMVADPYKRWETRSQKSDPIAAGLEKIRTIVEHNQGVSWCLHASLKKGFPVNNLFEAMMDYEIHDAFVALCKGLDVEIFLLPIQAFVPHKSLYRSRGNVFAL